MAQKVVGESSDSQEPGVYGENGFSPGFDVARVSGPGYGVRGHTAHGYAGVCGEGGENGVFGVTGSAKGSGVFGRNNGAGKGVAGYSATGPAIYGSGPKAALFDGNVEVTGEIQLGPGHADCAEEFELGSDGTEHSPGTVMVIRENEQLAQSSFAYDRRVAGVVSGAGGYRPALVLDRQMTGNRVSVALVGKVYCKVDATVSPVEVGDLLTTSSTPGHAMRAADPSRAQGAIIGKALRALHEGRALLPILISLQ